MITRDMKCGVCGYLGKVEAHDTVGSIPESHIFKSLGKDSSGFLRFICPSCGMNLAVNPTLKITIQKIVTAYPVTTSKVERLPCIIWGALCLLISIFLIAVLGSWWTYIISAGLLVLSISFFIASGKKEIEEIHKR
jgi:hypothetical protein